MPVRVRLLAEDQRKMMQGKFGLLKRSMYVARHAASNWECDGQEHIKRWNYEVGQRSKILFHLRNNKISAMTHDDFVVTGPRCSTSSGSRTSAQECIQSKQKSSVAGRQRASKL